VWKARTEDPKQKAESKRNEHRKYSAVTKGFGHATLQFCVRLNTLNVYLDMLAEDSFCQLGSYLPCAGSKDVQVEVRKGDVSDAT
jgi:hypothetical protein